ncbi:hypothetical protein TRP8649_00594 [Pelagimonas phthalicica]|uniref:Uncharacterized protein n=1 Tax=Pelagimonas phthalicica TaxID=1037362 RepID=A0A238J839_9RHOB|nr:hypothetical protein [Pelagimonas phthalicica]TDS94961.1 hypothetical protein CLV87_1479 [Pelagimonas phthalicica]SMX26513.1 hypothetical protein TRP8649_00594 [Pelagimonas phthalicica]
MSKLSIKYFPVGGGLCMGDGKGHDSKKMELIRRILDQDTSATTELIDYVIVGESGSKDSDAGKQLAVYLSQEENWIPEADGNDFRYEAIMGDITMQVTAYDRAPDEYMSAVPEGAHSARFVEINHFNSANGYRKSFGFMYYATKESEVISAALFSKAIVTRVWAGIRALYTYVMNWMTEGQFAPVNQEQAEEIDGNANQEAIDVLEEGGEEVEDFGVALDEAAAELAGAVDLVAIGTVLGTIVFVGILLIGMILLVAIFYLVHVIWKVLGVRYLVINMCQDLSFHLKALHLDNVDEDKKAFPGILKDGAKNNTLPSTSKVRFADDAGGFHPTVPVVHYAVFQMLNNKKFLEGLGVLLELQDVNDVGESHGTDVFAKYEVHAAEDNEQAVVEDLNLHTPEQEYNDIGEQKRFVQLKTRDGLTLTQATQALGGEKSGIYDVVWIVQDGSL